MHEAEDRSIICCLTTSKGQLVNNQAMSLKFGAFVPTIAKLEIVPLIYRLPKGRAYGMARGLTSIRQASLVKLTTNGGVEGIGEARGPPAVTKAYLDLINSYFVGREVYGFEHAASAILSTHYHFGIRKSDDEGCPSGSRRPISYVTRQRTSSALFD